MKIIMYQVDAFTNELFKGNPAAVCLTEEPLSVDLMHKLAVENNLSETAFVYPEGENYHVRWFTPEVEIDLCGHATLATAYALFSERDKDKTSLTFTIEQGEPITVTREGAYLTLTFPVRQGATIPPREDIAEVLGGKPLEFYASRDIMVVYGSQEEVAALQPEATKLFNLDAFGIIATAPGTNVDFVSRYFAPGCGVYEDPATGSSHCTLVPYWAQRLKKTVMVDCQLSKRQGIFHCELKDDQIYIKGESVTLFKTEFEL